MCTYTDVYDFDAYCNKMGEYFDKNPFQPIGVYRTLLSVAWASPVSATRPEAQQEFISALSRAIPQFSRVLNGFFTGFDDLVRGELCLYRGELDDAEQYLKQSIEKAHVHDQYGVENRALTYLMHIAFLRGDCSAANSLLQKMQAYLNEKEYGGRFTIFDIACGFYQLELGRPEQIPGWLKKDFSSYAHPLFLENYANRVKARYHYQTCQYKALLVFINNALEQQMVLFGHIGLKVLQALSLYQLKRRGEAIAAFAEAYHLAEPNRIITPFILYAKDMRTLTAAALKDAMCPMPKEWLEDINRKSSAYAKRKAKMLSDYRRANHLESEITLTTREISILKDLAKGLSRTEIATGRNISINTVKMAIAILYDKLCVTSQPDAIRVAVEHNII